MHKRFESKAENIPTDMDNDLDSYKGALDDGTLKEAINEIVFLYADPRMTLSAANGLSEKIFTMVCDAELQ